MLRKSRPRNFVLHGHRLHLVDYFAFCLLSPAWMQGTRARWFYARLRPHSVWRSRYGFLLAQRHTTDQKKTTVVLGVLAARNYFRDGSARCSCSDRALYSLHRTSSLSMVCQHLSETAIESQEDSMRRLQVRLNENLRFGDSVDHLSHFPSRN